MGSPYHLAGHSPGSSRRLGACSPDCPQRFELAFARAEEHVRALSWEATARRLASDFGAGWSPLGDDLD
jgi:hypothetical protein